MSDQSLEQPSELIQVDGITTGTLPPCTYTETDVREIAAKKVMKTYHMNYDGLVKLAADIRSGKEEL